MGSAEKNARLSKFEHDHGELEFDEEHGVPTCAINEFTVMLAKNQVVYITPEDVPTQQKEVAASRARGKKRPHWGNRQPWGASYKPKRSRSSWPM